MNPEYIELLGELFAATAADRVNWHRTAAENQFVVYFRSVSIATRFVSPENDADSVGFTLRDEAGKVIDQFWIDSDDPEWQEAREIYSMARRKALGIDVALRTILSELKSGKTVGAIPPPPKPEDDDEEVPF